MFDYLALPYLQRCLGLWARRIGAGKDSLWWGVLDEFAFLRISLARRLEGT